MAGSYQDIFLQSAGVADPIDFTSSAGAVRLCNCMFGQMQERRGLGKCGLQAA